MAKKKKVLTQRLMHAYCTLRQRRRLLESQAREVGSDEARLKSELVLALSERWPKEKGSLIPEWVDGRRNISWKNEFEKALGKKKVAEVEANTPKTKELHIRGWDD